MAEPLASTVVATTTSAAAAAAAAAGWPPSIVFAAAVAGGLVSVWLEHAKDITLSARWFVSAVAHVFVSSAAGVALSAAGVAVAANPESYLHVIADVPQWSMAGVIAALIHRAAPLLWSWGKSKAGVPEGGSNG